MNILQLLQSGRPFCGKWQVVVDIFWLVVGGCGYILAGGGRWWMVVGGGEWWWVVVDIFWLVVGDGGWWWVVVGGGGYILDGGGWWWVVVGHGIIQSNPRKVSLTNFFYISGNGTFY